MQCEHLSTHGGVAAKHCAGLAQNIRPKNRLSVLTHTVFYQQEMNFDLKKINKTSITSRGLLDPRLRGIPNQKMPRFENEFRKINWENVLQAETLNEYWDFLMDTLVNTSQKFTYLFECNRRK